MSEPALHTIIGMISGTSMDGIDIALLQTDGLDRVEFGPADTRPYPAELRQELIDFLHDPARAMTDPLTGLEAKVTEAFSKALLNFLSDHSLTPAAIDLVGLHGQTVYHNPALRFALAQQSAWPAGTPIVFHQFHPDLWTISYFNSQAAWIGIERLDLAEMEKHLAYARSQRSPLWLEATTHALLQSDPAGRQWLATHERPAENIEYKGEGHEFHFFSVR